MQHGQRVSVLQWALTFCRGCGFVCSQAESLVQHLASDMASEGIEAKTLTLKLKTTAFEVRVF